MTCPPETGPEVELGPGSTRRGQGAHRTRTRNAPREPRFRTGTPSGLVPNFVMSEPEIFTPTQRPARPHSKGYGLAFAPENLNRVSGRARDIVVCPSRCSPVDAASLVRIALAVARAGQGGSRLSRRLPGSVPGG